MEIAPPDRHQDLRACQGGRSRGDSIMQFLLEHVQKGKTFALWARYELLGQEEKLVEQYNIRQVILVDGNPREEWSRARKMAGSLAICVPRRYLLGRQPRRQRHSGAFSRAASR